MIPTTVFKALADDTRARITLLIQDLGELCVCELTTALNESQPKISRHLAILRQADLVLDRRQGQWVYYRINPDLPTWITDLLMRTADANQHWLQPHHDRLQGLRVSASSCS